MADEALVDRLDQTIDALLARGDATSALNDPELAPLAVLAAQLRHAPSAAFRARLLANLTRRTTMTTLVLEPTKIREGFTTVTPYVRMREAGLLDFLTTVFDAKETFSVKGSAGGVHREVRVGDSMLMIGEGGDEGDFPFSPAAFHVYVPGCRRHVQARDRGGRHVDGRSRGSAVWRTRRVRQGRIRQSLVHRDGVRIVVCAGRTTDDHAVRAPARRARLYRFPEARVQRGGGDTRRARWHRQARAADDWDRRDRDGRHRGHREPMRTGSTFTCPTRMRSTSRRSPPAQRRSRRRPTSPTVTAWAA